MIMRAKDFRAQARAALRGKWGIAVLVGLVASILSGSVGITNTGSVGAEGYLDFGGHNAWIMILTLAVAGLLLSLLIGGAIQMGWAQFNTKLIKGQDARFGDLFSQFHRLWTCIGMTLVMGFFIILWSLLLIIPGIIAAYRYAMVPYLMAEFPDLGIMDAMRESKRLMKGNKWRLFCLEVSFFGWGLLGALTVIGSLWVVPYIQAAMAAFYMDVTGRGPRPVRQEHLNQQNNPEF